MRRLVLLLVSVGILLTLFAGSALAYTKGCNRGTEKADKMTGGPGDNAICGERGNDKIYGRGGEDTLVGGQDDDTVDGGDGNDKIKGSTGKDVLRGGSGDDILRAGAHNKTNDGVRDIVYCGPGVDTVYFTPGVDVVRDCEVLNP